MMTQLSVLVSHERIEVCEVMVRGWVGGKWLGSLGNIVVTHYSDAGTTAL